VDIIAAQGANINRIHYDRRVDLQTVFWEITCSDGAWSAICHQLEELGYLRRRLDPVTSLNLTLRLPNRPGALQSLLPHVTGHSAIITSIAFDDAGSMPDSMVLTVDIQEAERARALVDALSPHFEFEEIQLDGLGDMSFYIQFARKLALCLPDPGESAVLDMVQEINRLEQDLNRLGANPQEVFNNVLEVARTIHDTCNDGFFADTQTFGLSPSVMLHCIQLPCGGNVFLFHTNDRCVMLDTAYGAYHDDLMRLFAAEGLCVEQNLSHLIISHADADHCGGAGYLPVPAMLHPATLATIRAENRAWGSPREHLILESVYTKMIDAFSRCRPPTREQVSLLPSSSLRQRNGFPVLTSIDIGDLTFEILESPGGHQVGQIFLFCEDSGLLFTADSLIPLHAISAERSRYNRFADSLLTSVNVDSALAKQERRGLLDIATEYERRHGRSCTILAGHGPVCALRNGRLEVVEPAPQRYTHSRATVSNPSDG